jgi:hypothetical protein
MRPPSTLRFLFQDRLNLRVARDQGEQVGSSGGGSVQEVLSCVGGVGIPRGYHVERTSGLDDLVKRVMKLFGFRSDAAKVYAPRIDQGVVIASAC